MRRIFDLRDIVHILYPVLPISFFYFIARIQGHLAYKRNLRLREIVRNNLVALSATKKSETELDDMTREFFIGQSCREMQRVLMTGITPATLAKILPIKGLEHLDKALKGGKGVILLASHLNSASNLLFLQRLRQLGYDAQVAFPTKKDPFKPSRLGQLLSKLTGAKPVLELIGAFYAQFNIRPIMKCLNNNGIVMILGDGTHSASFVRANFMGRTVFFTTGPFNLARMSGAALIFSVIDGMAPDNLNVQIESPVHVPKTDNQEQDMEQMGQEYANRLEKVLSDNITQWQHLEFRDILTKMETVLDQSLTERLKV